MKIVLNIFLLFFSLAQSQNTISLYYNIGKYKLDIKNKKRIKNELNKLNRTKKYKVTIISSTDYLGSSEANYRLAKKRADDVIFFLNKNDTIFKEFSIINRGEIPSNNYNFKGARENRKVEIIFSCLDNIFDKISVGKKIVLKDVNFKTGKTVLLKKAYSSLKKMVQFLKNNPNIEIEITGHVCCNAGIVQPFPDKVIKLDEKQLSTRRANFIYRYLIYKGINKNRLSYSGYGFQTPLIYPEKTTSDMQKNKRVEIIITKI